MKRSPVGLLLPLLLLPLLIGCGAHDTASVTGSPKPSPERETKAARATLPKGSVVQVKVVAVTDGDTVRVLTKDKKEVRMRLNGVDAPESKQAFGAKSKSRLSDLVFGKTVTAKVMDIDRYDRAVSELTLGGASVNHRMVRDGFAWWYRQYAKKDKDLERLEKEARKAKRGLWADKAPQAPWEWRKEQRAKSQRGR